MQKILNPQKTRSPAAVLLMCMLLTNCASQSGGSKSDSPSADNKLTCTLISNCVDSMGAFAIGQLRYEGNTAKGMTILKSTLATFSEASIVASSDSTLEAVFTTGIGFKDQVQFVIDPAGEKINFRSRSNIGLYDFGKNRSRMDEFTARFNQQRAR
jgi:uncharacterized protein (DUF1499 family)